MNIGAIEGATALIGKPSDMTDDECKPLLVRQGVNQEGRPVMISAWIPTKEELDMLNAGESVKLWIFAHTHPVVSLTVGPIERINDETPD